MVVKSEDEELPNNVKSSGELLSAFASTTVPEIMPQQCI